MLGHVAVGTWSGGRFMRFGEPISDERLEALLRPGGGIDTLITADAYGAGEADRCSAAPWPACRARDYALVGAVGHDFYEGERDGREGLPALHRPAPARPRRLRRLPAHGGRAQPRALRRRLLRRAAAAQPGPARLRVARGLGGAARRCATRAWRARSGSPPARPTASRSTLIGCFERYGELIDWAMLILNPFEPWPGELALAAAARHDVRVITRVVDYGGLFHDDVLPGHELRAARPPRLPARGLGRGRARAARPDPPDRRAPRAHAAPARLRLEPRPPRRSSAWRRR